MKKMLVVILALFFILGGSIAKNAIKLQETSNPTVQFYSGWNLIPGQLDSTNSCEPTNMSAMFIYLPIEKKYIGGRVVNGQLESSVYENMPNYQSYFDTHLVPGYYGTSVWAYYKEPCSATMKTEKYPSSIGKKIFEGWNFISVTGSMVGVKPNEFFSNCKIQKIYAWSPTDQKWQNLLAILDRPEGFSEGSIGQSFLVKVETECTLSGTLTQPEPPITPPLPE